MIRWVLVLTAAATLQTSVPLVDSALADERPLLKRLAMLSTAGGEMGRQSHPRDERYAQARTCKAVSSCEEAVRLWCGGYRRADGDNDGIPCENVCSSLSEVEAIKAEIGC